MTRAKTGIPGLDELMDGGLPKGSLTLLSGKCGTGKSIFAMQYIVKGITDYGESGVFVSFERERDPLIQDMQQFGWHLELLEKQGALELMGGALDRITEFGKKVGAKGGDLIAEIIEAVKEIGAERLALDGLGQFSMLFPDKLAFRSSLAGLQRGLSKLGCTSILTSEIEEGGEALSRLGVEEYVADGVIVLHYRGDSMTRTRALEVRKLRGSKHAEYLSPFEITDGGIRIVEPDGLESLKRKLKWMRDKSSAGESNV